MAWVPDGVLVLGQSRGMVSTSALCLRFEHPGRRLDMLIWEACALRHSCRDLLAKGGFRLCQAVYYRTVYTYIIIYFPRAPGRRRRCGPPESLLVRKFF